MRSNLEEAERRIEEVRRTRAESLDLGDLALRELPSSLGDLPDLEVLFLGKYKPEEAGKHVWDDGRDPSALIDVSLLSGLQKLQDLYLSGTSITDLEPLAGLLALQYLDLSGCNGVTDLEPLAGLLALQNIDLSSCKGVTDLEPLTGLQALQYLDLSGCTSVTDLKPLAGLLALQNLNLIFCFGVTDLEPLAGLQALQDLNMSSCRGVTDLEPLAGLQALQNLNLDSCNGVTDLKPLAGLQALQSLDLYSCNGVTDLEPLARLQALQNLYLSGCNGVTDLEPLARLQALQTLYLSYCKGVTDLEPLTGILSLQKLNLYGCRPAAPGTLQSFVDHTHLSELFVGEASGVPQEVLSHHEYDNCLPSLRTYFSELDLGAEAENEVKVILLGNGRVGKTQLCRRFRGEPFDESVQSTHGVQIWREKLGIQIGDQEQAFQANWWDFGGQDIYHGTHALFLRSRAVFLILWTPNLENRDEFEERGIPLRNQPLAYWLDYVRTLAGEDSPVIVVQSQCDRFADRRPDPPRPNGFGFFECCHYSAKDEKELGRETLEAHFRNAIRYLLEQNGKLEIGRGRAKVRNRLYEWRSEDQKHRPEERQHRTLTPTELQVLCYETGGIVSWKQTLDYFHHTGVLFHRPDLFSNCIVLDQDWALDAVYTVFHRGREAPWLRDSGRFTREDLALLAWQEHSLEEQRLFLGLMESCGVCFPCGETAQGETRYVAPDLLPKYEAVAGKLHFWKDEPSTPTLRLEYRFFHPAIIRNLMSEIGKQAGELAEYWKYGFWFKDGKRDTQLLVQYEDTSTKDSPGAGALELKAQGGDALGLLREIRRAILQQQVGEKPEELLTLNGTTVSRGALGNVIEDDRVLDLQRKLVSGTAFAAFFEDREHNFTLAAVAVPPRIDIDPQPPTPNEKRRIFISYAWGDDTPEGKKRTEVVDALEVSLADDGFQPIRDRDQIQAGDLISGYIRRLTRADLVVAVISDKYLRSPYCMYEIYKIWQRCQGDANTFSQSLVPIILPEVKVRDLRDRLPYMEYWADQAESLEPLIRNPKLRPSAESWEEVRRVREFAHHVDDILMFLKDVLMLNKLEAHLDNGFEAVRDALRRRIE